MEKRYRDLILILILILFSSGCVKLALQFTPSLIPHFTETIFEECDPELAKSAIPANLKLLEGLLKNDPTNRKILSALSMGFTGYSMLFIEEDDPERASEFYLRARDYGIRGLGDKGSALLTPGANKRDLQRILGSIGHEDLMALVWTTISWNGWINLNLDKPTALVQLNLTQACLERIMTLDTNYFYGLPYILLGTSLSARPPMLGGNPQQAKRHFERALEISQGKFFLTQYFFARYYAVRVQDKKLFFELIEGIIKGDPHELKDACLMNTVIQHRARALKKKVDELFF